MPLPAQKMFIPLAESALSADRGSGINSMHHVEFQAEKCMGPCRISIDGPPIAGDDFA
jgi:hypothetical protein